ncbi:5-formyltetrahydrofolate cyclo-ligase [Sulfurospirillum sp. 1612]|uniref:5-formyltetrahydrofolate cyclo-ligase n=1 Tax=Sulfurospirillum sp. 1612 TaxID=3094835 RepID=UPI002F9521BC
MEKLTFDTKQDFRTHCKGKLQKISRQNLLKRNALVQKKLLQLIDEIHAKNILFYWPLKREVDVRKLLYRARCRPDCNIYVPFMEGVSFKMVKFRLPLKGKKFNIKEPNNSFAKCKKIDLAIVPVLGVDGAFRRVGFGKGMYDRFFESLPYTPHIAFVELVDCHTTSTVSEKHDIQADIYITPYNTIKKREK